MLLEMGAGGLRVLVGSLRLRVLNRDELLVLVDMLVCKVQMHYSISHSYLKVESWS